MWARPVSLTAIFPLAVAAVIVRTPLELAVHPLKLDMRRKLALFKLNLHSSRLTQRTDWVSQTAPGRLGISSS